MGMHRYADSHCHLHHFSPADRDTVIDTLRASGCERVVVNGTSPNDWGDVAEYDPPGLVVQRAFGVHPWYLGRITDRSDWFDDLRDRLDADPTASIGEIGIDRARPKAEHARSEEVFLKQLDEAAVRDRPCIVHCVRAHDRLWQLIEKRALPRCGWLLHGWSGPAHLVEKFADRGAYFSFSAATLSQKNPRTSLTQTPPDRVLIETDAPYMPPPPGVARFELTDASGEPINHPGNLTVGYERAAKELGMDLADFTTRVADNFTRLFGSDD